MLWVLPLEPLAERYTEQWYCWFAQKCEDMGIEYTYLDGEQLTQTVETGVVLDAHGTNYWKFTQLQKVCCVFKEGKVRDGDAFFTMDLWHPGLEAIPYMAILSGLDIQVYGFLHAGSYTREDFASPMAPWARYFEFGWAKFCDGIFVGTKYHRGKFLKMRDIEGIGLGKRVFVTGNPWDTEEILSTVGLVIPIDLRENIIVYPHRWDIEKRPNLFVEMTEKLWARRQDFKVIITTSRPEFRSNDPRLLTLLDNVSFPYEVRYGLPKKEYYSILAKSKVFVSTTIEENFGYCAVEAMTFGVVPVLPDAYSHPELVAGDDRFLYDTLEDGVNTIDLFLDYPPNDIPKMDKYNTSIDRMLVIIKNRGNIPVDPVTFTYLWGDGRNIFGITDELAYGWNNVK